MAYRFPIKVKAAAALSAPLVVLVSLASLQVAASAREVRDVRRQAELATAAVGPSGVVSAVMNERNATTLWLFGVADAIDLPVDSMQDAREETDTAVEAFRAQVEQVGGDVARAYAPAFEALDGLGEQRAVVDAYEGERNIIVANPDGDAVWEAYSSLIDALTAPTGELSFRIDDEQLRTGAHLVVMAAQHLDMFARAVRLIAVESVQDGGAVTDQAAFSEVVVLVSEAQRLEDRILSQATGPYRGLGEELRVESAAAGALALGQETIETQRVDLAALLQSVSIADDESYYGFAHDVSEQVRDRADELLAGVQERQRWVVGMAALVLVSAGVVTLLVARSITRNLRSLTRQAKDLADRRLPEAVRGVTEAPLGEDVAVPALEPVVVSAHDEVADVADMLNTVQTSALDLAVEQAVLRRNFTDAFVSVARRNHGLLERQIDYITGMEADETRPRVLADLYELDHQATRMRRNAESLLVLAGADLGRDESAPARLGDVVRAALGEVASYERVRLKGIQPAIVVGPAVADVTHLLAELLDNALRFSPSEEPVEVRGHGRHDGYALAIIDSGTGMSPEEVEAANRRLARAEAHTTAPSTYLGHYVTAALAARHGIRVTLQSSFNSGIAATVVLPDTILVPRAVADRLLAQPLAPPAPSPSPPALAPALASGPAAGSGRQPAVGDGQPAVGDGWQPARGNGRAPGPDTVRR